MIRYNSDIDIDIMLAYNPIIIVEFGSSTCAPCGGIREKIDRYIEDKTSVSALYIPIEENRELCASYGVLSAPTVMAFVESNMTIREAGIFSLDDIFMRLDRLIGLLGDIEI